MAVNKPFLKSVTEFTDYRIFLKHVYEANKAVDPAYSYGKFAQRAELKSKNYLQLVISGARNLTVTNIHQFAKALDLDSIDQQFFETLVLNCQASGKGEKEYYSRRLRVLLNDKKTEKRIGRSQVVVSAWYVPILLLILDGQRLNEIEALCNSAAKLFKVSASAIKSAVEELEKTRMLVRDESVIRMDARYFYSIDRGSKDSAHWLFLKSQLERSMIALRTQYASGAKFYAHSFRINRKCLKQIEESIQGLLQEIADTSEECPGKDFLQINLQAFDPAT